MEHILNKDGYEISIDTVYQCWTYSGLMMGNTEDANLIIIASPSNRYLPTMWDKWPFLPLLLDAYKKDLSKELPAVASCVLLTSAKGTDGKADKNSSLVAFWFQDDFFQHPRPEIIDEIKNMEWRKLAKNWEW